jgi:hypothetical protein
MQVRSRSLSAFFLPLAALIVILLSSCGPKARIVGKVTDAFGKPVAGVDISIPSTTFKTTTDSSGEYVLPFAPGKFTVVFAKAGMTGFTVDEEIATETKVPLADVTLYQYPSAPGFWLIGQDSYIAVEPSRLAGKADPDRVDGDAMKIPSQPTISFLAYRNESLRPVALASDGTLMTHRVGTVFAFQWQYNWVEDNQAKLAKDLQLHKVAIESGQIAFATVREVVGHNPEIGFGWNVRNPVYRVEVNGESK